jgi:hypothetical protein
MDVAEVDWPTCVFFDNAEYSSEQNVMRSCRLGRGERSSNNNGYSVNTV